VDYLSPIQDAMSWLINSHIYNVRASLNNMFIVDPAAIEMADLKSPKPGKIIRLKPAAMGRDIRTVVQQLNVGDVTQNHINDFSVFMRLGDVLSAVNDNSRGSLDANSSRKTATEVRTAAESGSSRLAAMARNISAQQMVDLAEQMSVNLMQFTTQEYALKVLGKDGESMQTNVSPDMIMGDFNYPVHDGSLPVDKLALLQVWQEIFAGVTADPELRQKYNIFNIFEHIAELGGAKNIEEFRMPVTPVQTLPDEQVAQQAQAGNMVPAAELLGG
jgi:hypothetical protein